MDTRSSNLHGVDGSWSFCWSAGCSIVVETLQLRSESLFHRRAKRQHGYRRAWFPTSSGGPQTLQRHHSHPRQFVRPWQTLTLLLSSPARYLGYETNLQALGSRGRGNSQGGTDVRCMAYREWESATFLISFNSYVTISSYCAGMVALHASEGNLCSVV